MSNDTLAVQSAAAAAVKAFDAQSAAATIADAKSDGAIVAMALALIDFARAPVVTGNVNMLHGVTWHDIVMQVGKAHDRKEAGRVRDALIAGNKAAQSAAKSAADLKAKADACKVKDAADKLRASAAAETRKVEAAKRSAERAASAAFFFLSSADFADVSAEKSGGFLAVHVTKDAKEKEARTFVNVSGREAEDGAKRYLAAYVINAKAQASIDAVNGDVTMTKAEKKAARDKVEAARVKDEAAALNPVKKPRAKPGDAAKPETVVVQSAASQTLNRADMFRAVEQRAAKGKFTEAEVAAAVRLIAALNAAVRAAAQNEPVAAPAAETSAA